MRALGGEASIENPCQLRAPAGSIGKSYQREPARDDVGALVQTLLDRSVGDAANDIPAWLDLWVARTGRSLPSEYAARAEYFETLPNQNDLSSDQQAEIFRRFFPKGGTGLSDVLESATAALLTAARPWFPLWHAYVDWTLQWCAHHGYAHLTFLCRDALPFYVIANELRDPVLGGRPVTTGLLHTSRRLAATPNFERHILRNLPADQPAALIDSGCYGSLIAPIIDILNRRKFSERNPAVFFYFSRNPQIFGYVNHLAAWESLSGAHAPGEMASLCDFVIRAGDVVEALPKPYAVERLRDDGTPSIRLQDVVSFVLGASLISALRAHIREHHNVGRHRDCALRTLQTLWKTCRQEQDQAGFCTLFSASAPKSPPSSDAYRNLWGLPPQEGLFGISGG